jgi:hypothetical protein
MKTAIKAGRAPANADEHRIPVRVIEYLVKGRGESETIRLITTILDPQEAPADTLAALYQQRWEHELVFDEIKTHQMNHHRIIRSRTPDLVKQEIWGLLITHYATQVFITEAADELYLHALIEIGLVLFIITLIVNSLSRLLIWSMQPHRQAARATAVVAKAAA